MATGRLGIADLTATTNASVYTVPAGKIASFNISVCNRNNTEATIRIAVASAATPTVAEYIEYDATIPGNSVLERTGIIADEGKIVVAYSNVGNISVVIFGIEE